MHVETTLIGDNEEDEGFYFYQARDLVRCRSAIFCIYETADGWAYDFTGGEGPWSEVRFPSRQAAVNAASSVAFDPDNSNPRT
jgi:hypothetical protein